MRVREITNYEPSPNTTIEADVQECIALAYSLVKQRLADGSATSQETTLFLKMASEREKTEIAKMRQEIEVQKAKIQNLEAQQRTEEMFEEAIRAMKGYSGETNEPEDYSDILGDDFDSDI